MNKKLEDWKRLSRRVRAMSPHELADRLRQQAAARIDFLRYRLGISFEPHVPEDAALAAAPRFFFSAAEIPQLCSLVRELFPEEAKAIVERAERICQHRFDLLGYKDLDYGAEIDWHADRVHGKRAPRKPGFQVHYLDFAEVGDSKVTWEISRHQHLVTLAKAYRLSGEEKFAAELFRQWKHWHRENPYPVGINWASSLEVAFRSLSWLWMYFLMSGSAAMPAGFRRELVRKLAVSGRHIETYLSTYFSANTHLMGEGVALFFIGVLCPELRSAERWREKGWSILQQEAERQVRADGFHFEQSTYYHVYAADFFLHSAILASRNEIAIPPPFEATMKRMLDALSVLGRAGPVAGLGDDDGGCLFDSQRNRTEHLLDPLATGAVLFGRGDYKALAGGLREETVWLLGEAGRAEFDRLPMVPAANRSAELQNSGFYVMADEDLGRQMVIDAGPQGEGSAGHGHADALSVTANVGKRAVLIDSGTCEYVGEGSKRNRFRGSRAHNTLTVDGLDQSAPKGPFSWVNLPNVRAEEWIEGETFDLFVGSHDGYTRLPDPVVHRRSVFSRKGRFWLIRDQALGTGDHQLDLYWHLSSEFLPAEPLPGERARTTFRTADTGFSIVAPENHGWSCETSTESRSPAYGREERHCVLRLSAAATLPAELATLLIAAGRSHVDNFVRISAASGPVACYGFKTAGEQHLIVFGEGKPWKLLPWSSDATFFYWSEDQDRNQRTLICCEGSYLEAGGARIVGCPQTFSRCEVTSKDGKIRTSSSAGNVTVNQRMFETISLEQAGSGKFR
jgi:hypothetical protein